MLLCNSGKVIDDSGYIMSTVAYMRKVKMHMN